MKKSILLLVILFSFKVLYAQTTVSGSFIYDGTERTYQVYIPASYDGYAPVPVIFNLHGLFVNADIQQLVGDFKPIADTAGFLLVLPNGAVATGIQSWNTGFSNSQADDVGFLDELIDTLAMHYNIDLSRVYSTGYSNGGFMSYLQACSSEKFAAIASISGTMTDNYFNACSPQHEVPVMHLHGTSDNIVFYNGNPLMVTVDDLIKKWVHVNNCDSIPVMVNVPNINTGDGVTAEHYYYSPEGDGVAKVEFFKMIGGGHTWPGSTGNIPIPILFGAVCQDFNACDEIWRFFKQFSNPFYSGIRSDNSSTCYAWPNPALDYLNIIIKGGNISSIKIFNMTGQEVCSLKGKNIPRISVSGLVPGLFVAQIESSGGITMVKFVKN